MTHHKSTPDGLRLLLMISGSVAAYKSLELIRLWKTANGEVRCVMTEAATRFITPLSVAALAHTPVARDLFALEDETTMGQISLSRNADLVLVAPASADIIAKMAVGLGDDLCTATLLACDKPVWIAPAMNHRMWEHPATQANIATLSSRGVGVIYPTAGSLACNEQGPGRMAEPTDIIAVLVDEYLGYRGASVDAVVEPTPLTGLSALVTSGPTREAIDPIRYISNRSSGKQGYAIAEALARAGATTTLISGPSDESPPGNLAVSGGRLIRVESAQQMLDACESLLPTDIAVCVAAVADWRPRVFSPTKLKKHRQKPPTLTLTPTPDILATLGRSEKRPRLIIGFAAETNDLLVNAREKYRVKGCDWLVANDVSGDTLGGEYNSVHILRGDEVVSWPTLTKQEVARRLVAEIVGHGGLVAGSSGDRDRHHVSS